MANFCKSLVGWHYLKQFGEDLSANSPPKHGVHQEELDDSDLWATAIVKANVADLWDVSGWDYPSAPPAFEDIALKFAASRIRFIMHLRDFPGEDQASSGAHKLRAMAWSELKAVRSMPFLISSTGGTLHKRKNMFFPYVSSRARRNFFTADELDAFRETHSIFSEWNYSSDIPSGLVLPI